MSRQKEPREVALRIVYEPYSITGNALLHLIVTKPKGGYEEILVKVNVNDVLCAASMIEKLKAAYKKQAQLIAEKL